MDAPQPALLVQGSAKNPSGGPGGPNIPYKPLDFDTYEVRLLKLHWDSDENQVNCSVEYTSLIDPGPYIALSYFWGDPSVTRSICVDEIWIHVTANLFSALCAVRKLKRRTGQPGELVTRLWVDALCINQKDAQERSHQVRNMRQIYSRAQEVLAFVGPGRAKEELHDVSGGIAMARLKVIHGCSDWRKPDIPSYSVRQKKLNIPAVNPKIRALEDCGLEDHAEFDLFFGQPYWRRAWVIQEISVGSKVTILYSGIEFRWDDVAAFFSLLKGMKLISRGSHDQSRNSLENSPELHEMLDSLVLKMKPQASKIFGVGPQAPQNPDLDPPAHLLEFRERFFVKRTPISLFEALYLSRRALATDPRDKIFALLGLCHDGSTFVPVPNYRQPLESVIADMSKAMMTLNKSLDVICLKGTCLGQTESTPVPTWAPNWQRIWTGGTTVQEDILLNQQNVGQFNPIMDGSTGNLLKVRGTRVGAITHLTSAMKPHDKASPAPPNRSPWISSTSKLAAEILELGNPSPDVSKFYSVIWRTLVMARMIHGIPAEKAAACFSTLWMPQGRGSIHNLDLIEWIDRNAFFKIGKWTLREWSQVGALPATPGSSGRMFANNPFFNQPTKVEKDLSLLDSFTDILGRILASGMRLACLDTRAYFIGMVHPDAREGDKVYYLKGCSVPVVLRRTSDPDKCHYMVIGGAYLDSSQEWGAVLADALLEDLILC